VLQRCPSKPLSLPPAHVSAITGQLSSLDLDHAPLATLDRRSWACERRACTGSRVDDWHITTLQLIPSLAQEQDRAQHAGNDGTGLHGLVAGLARGGIQSNARCLWGGGNDVCLFARLHAAHGQGGECNGNPNATSATASTQHLQKIIMEKCYSPRVSVLNPAS
jgi:hypothetical protein